MLIILDRDGVINQESHCYIKSPAEWHPILGSLEAIALFKKAGYQVVVATNQSGIARGLFSKATLRRIHLKMNKALSAFGVKLDGIFYCPHHPDEHCVCRKPAPGLLLIIAQRFNVDLRKVYCIGDSLRDIKAAQRVGAKPILVLTGNGRETLSALKCIEIEVYNNLAEAAHSIVDRIS